MPEQDWLPENSRENERKTPYILVPLLQLSGLALGRLNLAGWVDPEGSTHACKTCKKQVRLSLKELSIFPLVKPGTDLFQFSYSVPQHKVGGAFSAEICGESESKILKEREYPTSIRFGGEAPEGQRESQEEPTDESVRPRESTDEVDRDEIRKSVAALSPEEAEERYNYLQSRPISELPDAENEERLALLDRLTGKSRRK